MEIMALLPPLQYCEPVLASGREDDVDGKTNSAAVKVAVKGKRLPAASSSDNAADSLFVGASTVR